jgi:hypothetical protein
MISSGRPKAAAAARALLRPSKYPELEEAMRAAAAEEEGAEAVVEGLVEQIVVLTCTEVEV